jgi:hypothetical protein
MQLTEDQYVEVWGDDVCPTHTDGKHQLEIPALTFQCECGKKANIGREV